ncbi:hypothetical protein AB0J47_17785 [Nocardia sp. NPDC049737]|uniref:hypothetical protein n=1 Tax=Nocardia sp. NPDC049737 TaxID=3154358 RepID=UPI0034418E52
MNTADRPDAAVGRGPCAAIPAEQMHFVRQVVDRVSDPATYLRIAEQHELDADRVISDLADTRTRAVALRDFGRAAELGVHSYPIVLLQIDTGTVRLGGSVSDAAHLSAVLDQYLSAVTTPR